MKSCGDKTGVRKFTIVGSCEMGHFPFFVIYSTFYTFYFALPAYFNLLTLFNQTYKRTTHNLHLIKFKHI